MQRLPRQSNTSHSPENLIIPSEQGPAIYAAHADPRTQPPASCNQLVKERYTGPFTFLTLAAWSMSLAARHSVTPDRLWQQGLYAEVAPKHVKSTAALEAACLRGNASCVLVVTSSGSEEQDARLLSVLRRAGVILRLESAAAPSVALLAKDQAQLAGPELQKLIDSKGSGPRVFFLDGRQGLAFEVNALSPTESDERAALRSLLLEVETIQQGKRTPLLNFAQLDPGRDEL